MNGFFQLFCRSALEEAYQGGGVVDGGKVQALTGYSPDYFREGQGACTTAGALVVKLDGAFQLFLKRE